jgi:hypothetical protein
MKSMTIYFLTFIVFFAAIACSDDTSNTPTNNQDPIDTLTATITGELSLDFKSNAVNKNDYPNDTSTGMLFSGTMLVSPLELYNIYFFIRQVDDVQRTFEFDDFGDFTRFEKVLGATTLKTQYNRNISGSVTFTVMEEKLYKGSFSFSAETDGGGKIEVNNGYIEYQIPD